MAPASPQNRQEAAARHTMAEHSHQSWRSPRWGMALGPPWAWRLGVPRAPQLGLPGSPAALAPRRPGDPWSAAPRGGARAPGPSGPPPGGSGAPAVRRPPQRPGGLGQGSLISRMAGFDLSCQRQTEKIKCIDLLNQGVHKKINRIDPCLGRLGEADLLGRSRLICF
jgi:hypothetical protein